MAKHRAPEDEVPTSFAAGGRGDRVSKQPGAWSNPTRREDGEEDGPAIPGQRQPVYGFRAGEEPGWH